MDNGNGNLAILKSNFPIEDNEVNKIVEECDEYAYLKRNEFTSEIYKIEVRNLGYYGIRDLKKLLCKKLNLKIGKIKSPLHKDFAFISLRTEEEQQRAVKVLNGYKWKGKILEASIAKAMMDPLQRKRKEQRNCDKTDDTKKTRTSTEATCPLAGLPYDTQLKQKSEQMDTTLKTFMKELMSVNRDAREYLKNFRYLGIDPSPQLYGYRNKNEFSVGRNAMGDIVVGFRLGSYVDGCIEVGDVDDLPHIPDAAKWAARTFQEFVKKSRFEPFNPECNVGHFRQLTARTSSHSEELMLIAGIYSSNLSADDLEILKNDLRDYYATLKVDEKYQVTSLYYQDVKRRDIGQTVTPIEHLYGTKHIVDKILDKEFRISPLAFFQINTAGANILYQRVIDLAAPQSNSTVLDICCGTGTIAISFAKHCKQVFGVEIITDAVKDAEYNAQKNNVSNCTFFTGNADDYINVIVKQALLEQSIKENQNLIAIIDPPRDGLHNRSILAIRSAEPIKRLIYISCNPQRAKRNWIELCRTTSKQYKGIPFIPTVALAVDMFPHTAHTEMIVVFERQSDVKLNSETNLNIQMTIENIKKIEKSPILKDIGETNEKQTVPILQSNLLSNISVASETDGKSL